MSCSGCSTGRGCGTASGSLPGGCRNNGACGAGGCNKLNVFDWLADVELPSSQKLFDCVEVRFKNSRKEFYRNTGGQLKLKIGDIPVNLLIAHAGKEYFSEKAMAAYRVNPGSLMTTEEYSDYSLIKERISAYNFFNRHTGKIYDTAIKKELTVKYYQLVKYCHEKNRPVAKVYYTVLHNYYSIGLKNNKPRSFKEKINISLNYLRFIFKNVYP